MPDEKPTVYESGKKITVPAGIFTPQMIGPPPEQSCPLPKSK